MQIDYGIHKNHNKFILIKKSHNLFLKTHKIKMVLLINS
jgi:hypothetical protein